MAYIMKRSWVAAHVGLKQFGYTEVHSYVYHDDLKTKKSTFSRERDGI
jgi:hypothetical protein